MLAVGQTQPAFLLSVHLRTSLSSLNVTAVSADVSPMTQLSALATGIVMPSQGIWNWYASLIFCYVFINY